MGWGGAWNLEWAIDKEWSSIFSSHGPLSGLAGLKVYWTGLWVVLAFDLATYFIFHLHNYLYF